MGDELDEERLKRVRDYYWYVFTEEWPLEAQRSLVGLKPRDIWDMSCMATLATLSYLEGFDPDVQR